MTGPPPKPPPFPHPPPSRPRDPGPKPPPPPAPPPGATPRQHGRPVEPATLQPFVGRPGAADQAPGPFFFSHAHVVLHLLARVLVDERPDLGRLLESRSQAQPVRPVAQPRSEERRVGKECRS